MKIIGFTGRAGSGKDTAVIVLKEKYTEVDYGCTYQPLHYSFASPIRNGLSAMLGAELEFLSHDPKLKNEPVEPYGVSPRTMLQTLGTEWGRALINQDIWVLRAKEIWKETSQFNQDAIILISDCRFDNEAEAILSMGGIIVEIVRLDNPHTSAINSGGVSNHASENGINQKLISHTIANSFNSKEEFENRIITDPFITSYLKA